MDFDTDLLSSNAAFSLHNAADPTKQKCYGFGFRKQDRTINEEDLRDFKISKTSSCGEGVPRYPLQRSNGCGTLSAEGHQQQMLSFTSPTSQPLTLPYYRYTSNDFGRNTGINGGSMQGLRGPFTPSQWMELEHQALIYKYITANVPIPSYLLNPIKKAFDSAGFSVLRSNALGWCGFQLGFSNSDPEPGRCRRTDGKKWRCSRDAVVDQKYCERHMNRGRHRSRKPVEVQPGHSNANPNPKPTSINHQRTSTSNHLSGIPTISRGAADKQKVEEGATISKATAREQNAFQEFGLVCSDSLLNPLSRSSSQQQQAALRQFMDEWPTNQSDCSALSWPHLDMQPDRTQLSISIPMVTSDFMSSTSSPTTASPPRDLQMGLGLGDRSQRQSSWVVPISTAIGGPLGEALHNRSNTIANCSSNTKQLNLIDSWDNSPRLASSPTGVLQRGPFASLSNSSAASSPRSSHCNGIVNPGLMNPSLPAL